MLQLRYWAPKKGGWFRRNKSFGHVGLEIPSRDLYFSFYSKPADDQDGPGYQIVDQYDLELTIMRREADETVPIEMTETGIDAIVQAHETFLKEHGMTGQYNLGTAMSIFSRFTTDYTASRDIATSDLGESNCSEYALYLLKAGGFRKGFAFKIFYMRHIAILHALCMIYLYVGKQNPHVLLMAGIGFLWATFVFAVQFLASCSRFFLGRGGVTTPSGLLEMVKMYQPGYIPFCESFFDCTKGVSSCTYTVATLLFNVDCFFSLLGKLNSENQYGLSVTILCLLAVTAVAQVGRVFSERMATVEEDHDDNELL